jgi:hypothetical protein
LFILTLVVPVIFALVFDVDSVTRSNAIVQAYQSREDAGVKVLAQVKTKAAQPEAHVR